MTHDTDRPADPDTTLFIAPILLGDGVRLFDHPGGTNVRLERFVPDGRVRLVRPLVPGRALATVQLLVAPKVGRYQALRMLGRSHQDAEDDAGPKRNCRRDVDHALNSPIGILREESNRHQSEHGKAERLHAHNEAPTRYAV